MSRLLCLDPRTLKKVNRDVQLQTASLLTHISLYRTTMSSQTGPQIVIIGAGSGGLSCAIALKRKWGFTDFIIYEKSDEVGGTWRDNIYPGCSSDVPMSFYSLSTDLHNWKESHGAQPDTYAYWVSLARKYDLYPTIRFNTKVLSATWDATRRGYEIVVADSRADGVQSTSFAPILISAIGVLEMPRFAEIPGLAAFKGEMFHSARWDSGVALQKKRVGVVGNGASAYVPPFRAFFVPMITKDPSVEVLQFCRTPHWLMPPIRKPYAKFRLALNDRFPFLLRLARWWVYIRMELIFLCIFTNRFTRYLLTRLARAYIRYAAPEKYADKLIPTFTLGCKRIIYDTGFLSALHRPNLDLNWDGIERIVEDGIVTKTGEHIKLDVLIFATGYSADYYPFPVRGRTQTIQEYYEESEGAKAYLGTTIPGFPNFFVISGPNTITGHTSVIYTSEVQIGHLMQLIKPILDSAISSIEVRTAPTDAYNATIHASIAASVYTRCVSWYRVGGEGKVTNIFPRSATTFWWWLRRANFEHYIVEGKDADRFVSRRRNEGILRKAALGVVVALVVAGARALYSSWVS
ncbi:hypothetical protein D9619_012105 [Psilocybe cf. subviscida]|uniref:FAD/NAD(P)-binding domain-containing protein n=1 Tax=Psilocybe cf. subviscida TaxID=2480587 RepID=A0A8H5B753_9AGAR|nr:hypothetical protein D9619_012105 [Psilocybe cf. subviscida]